MYFASILSQYARDHTGVVVASVLFMVMMPMNDVLLPHLFGQLVESIRTNTNFMRVFTAIVITMVVVQLGAIMSDWHDTHMNPHFQSYVRNAMLNTLFDKHRNAYEDVSVGHLIATFIKAPNVMLTWFARCKDHLIPFVLVFLSASAYFMYHDVLMGVCVIALIVMMGVIMVSSPRSCMARSNDKAQLYSVLQDEIDDVIRNLMSVFTSNASDSEIDRLARYDGDHIEASHDTMTCAVKYKMLAFPLVIGFFVFFILRCNFLVQRGSMAIATFVTLLMMINSMMNNMLWIIDIIRDLVFDSGFIVHAQNQMSDIAKPSSGAEPPSPASPSEPPPHADGIGLHHVTFSYSSDSDVQPILQDVSMHFSPGDMTAITGPIGTGKSTITKLLERLNVPNEGDLYVDGQWYSQISTEAVRAKVGYVPQQPTLFNRSIYDNVRYGTTKTEADVDALADQLGVREGLPDMGTSVGKNGSHLSGGQRQLVWCMRTLLNEPEVIVLDEPTASMDEPTKKTLMRMLVRAQAQDKRRIVILVTHDDYVIQMVPHVVSLKAKHAKQA